MRSFTIEAMNERSDTNFGISIRAFVPIRPNRDAPIPEQHTRQGATLMGYRLSELLQPRRDERTSALALLQDAPLPTMIEQSEPWHGGSVSIPPTVDLHELGRQSGPLPFPAPAGRQLRAVGRVPLRAEIGRAHV